jgi:UbiD family decarboxylase
MLDIDRTRKLLSRYADESRRSPYPDLHAHVLALAEAGKLLVIDEPVNKDTEMHPLVRWQYRGGVPEAERKAFLFTRPIDSKGRTFEFPVLIAGLAGSADIYRIGFGKPLEEIGPAWVQATALPIKPNLVTDAPCQEVVIEGDALDEPGMGLDGLPVPISTPGWDNAPFLASAHYISADPDTGIQNVGNYRGQRKAPRRLGMNPSVEIRPGIYVHWEKMKARGERLPCAVVLGCRR